MIAALAALLRKEHEPVYQLCSADKNPLKVRRAGELIALSKRLRYREKSGGNALLNLLQAHTEPALVSLDHYNRFSAPAWRKTTGLASSLLGKAKGTPLAAVTEPIRKKTSALHKTSSVIEEIVGAFIPFITKFEYRFSAANTRALHARLRPEDQALLPWNPHEVEWRDYWLNVHTKGFNTWAEPLLIEKLEKVQKPLRRHSTLVDMVEDLTERYDHALAFQRLEGEQLTRVTYRDVGERTACVAARLADMGICVGDRVTICAKNHPDWALAYFGILRAGATAVPVDADIEREPLANILRASASKAIIVGEGVDLPERIEATRVDLHEITAPAADLTAPTSRSATTWSRASSTPRGPRASRRG